MKARSVGICVFAAFAAIVLLPNAARAQSAFAGIVKDATGGGQAANLLSYRQCDSACDNTANWSADQPLYFSKGGQSRIRVDAAGKIRIAWFQGQKRGAPPPCQPRPQRMRAPRAFARLAIASPR